MMLPLLTLLPSMCRQDLLNSQTVANSAKYREQTTKPLSPCMAVLKGAANLCSYLGANGISATANHASERFSEAFHEWRMGIRTAGKIEMSALGITDPFAKNYYPTDYRSIFNAFRYITSEGSFLDYGCGMGRVLAVAATRPFKRVIGVEISSELSEIARDNLVRCRKCCGSTEVITLRADEYVVPSDVTTIFFYNPFDGPVLSRVFRNIKESLAIQPRKLTIVFKNTDYLRGADIDSWLVKSAEFVACDTTHKIAVFKT